MTSWSASSQKLFIYTARSAQREPPKNLCLMWGDFKFADSYAWKAEVPPLGTLKQVWGVHADPTQLYALSPWRRPYS